MIFRFEVEEGPLALETEINGQAWQMYNDTVIGFDPTTTKLSASAWSNRSMSARRNA
jgi:hypothetical protein